MRRLYGSSVTIVALLLVVALVTGCGSSAPAATPMPAAAAAPTAAIGAQAASAPTAAPAAAQPTAAAPAAQPTQAPPTKAPAPTAVPATPTPAGPSTDVMALLKQVQEGQQPIKSARALMEIGVEGQKDGEPVSMTISMEIEMAEPDMHMKMSTKGLPAEAEEEMPGGFNFLNMEIIVKGDTSYLKMGEEWMAMPGGGDMTSSFKMSDLNNTEEFLKDIDEVKYVGRRTVKGVECDVISFKPSADALKEIAAMRDPTADPGSLEDIDVQQMEGEVAIGVADKMMREIHFKMSGNEKGNPAEKFSLNMSMSMWDINATNIVITAPANAKEFSFGFPTPDTEE